MDIFNFIDILKFRSIQQPNDVAYHFLSDDGMLFDEINYQQLFQKAAKLAAYLQENDMQGKRIVLLFPPGIDYIIAFFGCMLAGSVSIPLYPPSGSNHNNRLHSIINDAQVDMIVTTEQLAEKMRDVRFQFIHRSAVSVVTIKKVLEDVTTRWSVPEVSGHSLAFIQYTSGSTGHPKGVMLCHNNLWSNAKMIEKSFKHTTESRGLIWLPPYHDMGLIGGILQPLYGGFPVTLMSPMAFAKRPLLWLEAISQAKASISGGPNFAYDLCVNKVTESQKENLDLSHWTVAFNGAEPIKSETIKAFVKAFEPCGFREDAFNNCYGLAESTLFVTGKMTSKEPMFAQISRSAIELGQAKTTNDDLKEIVSCGEIVDEMNLKIVNAETRIICAEDEIGEIWVSGDSVAQGYWNMPEETIKTFQAHLTPTDGKSYLRTGDLGFAKEGNLFVTGRIKEMMIIRGRNYYPYDIEDAANQCDPSLLPNGAAAFTVEQTEENQLVCVLEVHRHSKQTDFEAVSREITKQIFMQFGLTVYDVVFVRMSSLPKTTSGKIQRHMCKTMYLENSLKVVFQKRGEDDRSGITSSLLDMQISGTSKEKYAALLTLFKEFVSELTVTPIDRIDDSVPIIAYGLDSLKAVQITYFIQERFGIEYPLESLLNEQTLAMLSHEVLHKLDHSTSTNGTNSPNISVRNTESDETDRCPLSYDQERLWFLEQLYPGSPVHHIPAALRVNGGLSLDILQKSVDALLARHRVLQCRFQTNGSIPMQIRDSAVTLRVEHFDMCHCDARDLSETIRTSVHRPFNLETGPLMRVQTYQTAASEHIVFFTVHHIVGDIASIHILLRETFKFYEIMAGGNAPLVEEIPSSYFNYVRWKRASIESNSHALQMDYWRNQLQGAASLLKLPTDRPRPMMQSFNGDQLEFNVPISLMQKMRDYCKMTNHTPYVVMLAVFQSLLYRFSQQKDIVIGSPTQGRKRAEFKDTVGYFAFPLLIRTKFAPESSFQDIVQDVKKTVLDAFAHQDIPLGKIVEAVSPERALNYNPLYQVMFSVVKSIDYAALSSTLELAPYPVSVDYTDFDLFLIMTEHNDDRYEGSLKFNTDLFDKVTVQRLIDSYVGILEQVLDHVETPVRELALSADLVRLYEQSRPAAETAMSIKVSSTFTAEPVEASIRYWMEQLQLPAQVEFSPFNQVFQSLLDISSPADEQSAKKSVHVLFILLDDWVPSLVESSVSSFRQTVNDFTAAVQAASRRTHDPFIVCVTRSKPAYETVSFVREWFDEALQNMEECFRSLANVYLISERSLDLLYPVSDYYDAHGDSLASIPYTSAYFTLLGTKVVRRIWSIVQPPYKVIVMDCDNTLWRGVCGEDGTSGIVVDENKQMFQEVIKRYKNDGMLLCLCSKNNEEDVFDVFHQRADMKLKLDDFVSWRINWRSKSENLKSMAEELRLGLDSFIYIDDDHIQCAEIEANCPEVLVLQMPLADQAFTESLSHLWALDIKKATKEDTERSSFYKTNAAREQFKSDLTLEQFIQSLQLSITISDLLPSQIERVSQLSFRTNQFNTTTKRRTEQEMMKLEQSGMKCSTVYVKDKFGDYGLVGSFIYSEENSRLVVDNVALSCRALGRGVEHRMLAHLGSLAANHNKHTVDILYSRSPKNKPVEDFLEETVGQYRRGNDCDAIYSVPTSVLSAVQLSFKQSAAERFEGAARPREQKETVSHYRPKLLKRIWIEHNEIAHIHSSVIEYSKRKMHLQ